MKDRLREIRGDMSKEDFARILDVSVDTLKSWESGRRTPSQLRIEQIAVKFGYNLKWIYEGVEPKQTLPLSKDQTIMEILEKERGKPYPKLVRVLGEIYAESDELDRLTLNRLVDELLEKMKEN